MPTEIGVDQVFADVRRCIAEGRLAHACSLLQAMILDIGPSPALREQKLAAYNALLKLLFAERRAGRLSKVFRQAISEFSEIRDAEFDNLYLAGALATGTPLVPLRRRDRFLSLLRKFDEVRALEGRVAECGCFQGLSSFLLCSRARRHDTAFDGTGYEIYDSFQGLSELRPEDMVAAESEFAPPSSAMTPGMYAATLDRVRTGLTPFPGISYFPGWIPNAFPTDNAGKYRFVHVDVDLYQPTLDSFRYFWPRLVPGAMVVCDDYNWPGGKRAVEEFCGMVGVPFDTTPMQQAYFSRPA